VTVKLETNIHRNRIPKDWAAHLLCVWQEDDATLRDPTAEHLHDAVVRLRGTMYECAEVFTPDPDLGVFRPLAAERSKRLLGDPLDAVDYGDDTRTLYNGGWVVGESCEGSALYRVVKSTSRVFAALCANRLDEVARMVRATEDPEIDDELRYIVRDVERALSEVTAPEPMARWCEHCRIVTGPAYDIDRPCRGKEPADGCKGGWK